MGEDVPHVLVADANFLKNILSNLISNAVRFTNQGHVKIVVCVAETSAIKGKVQVQPGTNPHSIQLVFLFAF